MVSPFAFLTFFGISVLSAMAKPRVCKPSLVQKMAVENAAPTLGLACESNSPRNAVVCVVDGTWVSFVPPKYSYKFAPLSNAIRGKVFEPTQVVEGSTAELLHASMAKGSAVWYGLFVPGLPFRL